MYQNLFLILLIGIKLTAFCGSAEAQIRRELRVIDAATRIPLPFVTLQSLDSSPNQATTSDVEGRFYWMLYGDSARLEARCVGYSAYTFTLRSGDARPIIAMQRGTTQLPEIHIKAGDNPAHRIIEEAIKRKKEHDPSVMGAHRCTLYHRFILTIDTTGAAFSDTILPVSRGDTLYLDSSQYERAEFIRARDLMLSESLVSRHYIGAAQPHDRMLATRTAGMQFPLFAVFSAQMQNFSVYNDPISLNELQYVGPLSPGSPRRYRFQLEESRPVGPDTLHVIRFTPNPGNTHNGLRGTIYIHSSTYAVQQVTAELADSLQPVGLRFNQVFSRLPSGHWYAYQTHTDFWLNQMQVNGIKVVGQVFTEYKDVKFGSGMERSTPFDATDARQQRDVPKIGMTILEDAMGKPIGYFEPFRPDSLNARDQETYRFIDSLGTASRLEQKIQWGESLLTGKIPLLKGRLDLNLPDVLSANGWEGLRLGVGLSTGDSVAQRIRLGGYAAYGFGDWAPKYGGYVDVHPDKQRNLRLRITARDDIRVNGGFHLFHTETSLLSTQPDRLLALFNRFFDRERVAALQFRWMNLGPLSGESGFLVGNRQAAPGRNGFMSNYRFISKPNPGDSSLWPVSAPSFPVSEWSVRLRYAPGETTIRLPGRSYTLVAPKSKAVVSLAYERGLPLQTDAVRFNRLLIRVERQFGMQSLGELDAALNLGAAWGPNPLPIQQLLFARGTGPGSVLFVPLVFQTFDMATFAGNRLASIHLQHRAGVLRLPGLKQNPLVSFVFNAGWSQLIEPDRHRFAMNESSFLPLFDLKMGYFEGGGVLSRLRILGNYMGVGLFYGAPGAAIGQTGTVWLADGSAAPLSPRRWTIKMVLTP